MAIRVREYVWTVHEGGMGCVQPGSAGIESASFPSYSWGPGGDTMFDSLRRVKQFRDKGVAWQKLHDANAPKIGDLAPDFELPAANGDGRVRLSSLRGRPVALIFGSFT